MLNINRKQYEIVWIFSLDGEVLGSITTMSKYANFAFGPSNLVYKREEILTDEELERVAEWERKHHG